MFLLGPVTSFDRVLRTEINEKIPRWDGQMMEHAASSAGSAHYMTCSAQPRTSHYSSSFTRRTSCVRVDIDPSRASPPLPSDAIIIPIILEDSGWI